MSSPTPTHPAVAAPVGVVARALVGIIRGYQRYVSPMLGPRCRFYPSCSCYASDALRHHGALRGSWLTVWRLLRCHPFHPGGHDPVPLPSKATGAAMASQPPETSVRP